MLGIDISIFLLKVITTTDKEQTIQLIYIKYTITTTDKEQTIQLIHIKYTVSKQNSGFVCQFGLVSFTFVPMKFPNRTLGMYVNSDSCLPRLLL